MHPATNPPAGYRKRRDGRLRPDPRSAPAVRAAFELRAGRATLADIGRHLRDEDVRSAQGTSVWTTSPVQHLLENRVYLGEARYRDYVRKDAHPPLVDPITWRLAQYPPLRENRDAKPGLLYGLLRCASCRSLMTISGHPRDRSYRCSRLPQHRGTCPNKAWIASSVIEPLAEDLLFAVARRRPQLTRKVQLALRRAEDEVSACERRLERYRDSDRLIDALTDVEYADGLEARSSAVRRAAEQLALRRADSISANVALLRGVQRRWPTVTLDQQRQALRAAFDALFVAPERGPVEERVWVCERGEAPTRLPFPRHPLPPRAFTFPTNQQATARQRRRVLAARKYGWTDAEIEKRLRTILVDCDVFPTPSQLIQAGERRLYDHVVLHGGGPVWAARLGVRYGQGNRKRCLLWTEERVHAS